MLGLSKLTNPRDQGDVGLGIAIGWFARNGYKISLPLTDSQDYDLIVDDVNNDNKLYKVQVRTTYYQRPSGSYEVHLRVMGGNQSGTGKVKRFDPKKVDYLFVVTDAGTMYLFPSQDITNRRGITLGKKYDAYRVT